MESQITWCTHCFDEIDLGRREGVVIQMARMTMVLCEECAKVVMIKLGVGLGLERELLKEGGERTDEGIVDDEGNEAAAREIDEILGNLDDEANPDETGPEQSEQRRENSRRLEERLLETRELMRRFTPEAIRELLDRDVIGHEEAKETLAAAAHKHLVGSYCRTADEAGELGWLALETPELVEVVPEKSNVLLVGPTGSGKTLLARKLAEILELPMISVSATRFTERGYVGESLSAVFEELFRAADYDAARAANGIIYIDEFDKLARRDNRHSRDISGLGIQQELLRLVEGDNVAVMRPGAKEPVFFSTENVLFICGGAFADLLKKLKRRPGIGFNNRESDGDERLTAQRIIDYGFLPELLGRLPVLIQLDELTEDELYRVLTEPRNALVKQFRKLALVAGGEFKLGEEVLREIARRAVELGTGARALRALLEEATRGGLMALET